MKINFWLNKSKLCLCILTFAPVVFAQQIAPSVVVSEVIARDITPTFSYVGRVEPKDKVELQARVEGTLEQRQFQEGSIVEPGALLFVIEQAPYQVVVDKMSADLAAAKASLENAQADYRRKTELRKSKAISQSDLDSAKAEESGASANVLKAQAALREAKLNLSYTEIRSPLAGQISRSTYSVGNLVGPNSDVLATITRTDPVYVTIAISEKDLIEARRQGVDLKKPKVAPFLVLGDESKYPHDGYFDYLDTEVNRSTDTVLARAVFPNPDRLLVAGQFVKVLVKAKLPKRAIIIAQSAVQEDQQGYFVLVVNPSDRVEIRRVRLGDQVDKDWVVEDGLVLNERVIVQGIQKVRPDMTVNPVAGD